MRNRFRVSVFAIPLSILSHLVATCRTFPELWFPGFLPKKGGSPKKGTLYGRSFPWIFFWSEDG